MKKISKSAQKKLDQAINERLRKEFDRKILEKERKKADEVDKLMSLPLPVKDLTPSGINNFNSKSFDEALKSSGVNTTSNIFEDMERVINNNESIRELVDVKNIRMKTNVTDEQHKYIVILYGSYKTLLQRYGIDFKGLRTILDEFIEISPSIDGKRAEQFVQAQQSLAQAVANANAGSHGNNIRSEDMKQ